MPRGREPVAKLAESRPINPLANHPRRHLRVAQWPPRRVSGIAGSPPRASGPANSSGDRRAIPAAAPSALDEQADCSRLTVSGVGNGGMGPAGPGGTHGNDIALLGDEGA